MIDLKLVEEKPELFRKNLIARGMHEEVKNLDLLIKLRKEWLELKKKLDEARHKRNLISLEINELLKKGIKEKIKEKKIEAGKIASAVKEMEVKAEKIEIETKDLALLFPNIVADLQGKGKVAETYSTAKKEKWMKNYLDICTYLGLINFESAVEMSGEGFYILSGEGARLRRALIDFFLDCARKNNYVEQFPPILVNEKAMINSGQLPKFRDGMYSTQDNLFLVPTSEVSLLNIYANKTLKEENLPIYITAYSPCFRTEKGATKGFMRVHQFDKVELFKFTKQEESFQELEKMMKNASDILKLLKIPHRIRLLSAEEIGIASAKTYDIEAFSPGLNEWLEVSSCSNCTDYQARRARIFYMEKGEKKLVHTLNGSGLALPRTFIAIIENYQQKDGSVKIPKVLHKYCGFKVIKAKK